MPFQNVRPEMFFIYSLLYCTAIIILLPFEYLKRPKDLRHNWLREKFGLFDAVQRPRNPKVVWVHAVSMGEAISAVPFIKEANKRHPEIHFILSTVTDTGRKVANDRLSDMAEIIYLPFDLVHIVKRAIKRFKPDAFISVETELWPNTFRTLKRHGIPVLIFNGRLSEKSFNGYKKIRFFIRRVMDCVDVFCMQEPVYAERIRMLGADEGRVKIVGNFKFDTRPPDKIPEWGRVLKGPVIIAGSTHEPEEDIMLDNYLKLKSEFQDVNIIIAPRHPERFADVEELIKKKGLNCFRVSEIKESGNKSKIQNPESGINAVIILDTVGELASLYSLCDIAIMGGSFIRHGGQNPLEPAFWGKPVICGPHMENFPFIEEFYKRGGAVKTDSEGLADVVIELMKSPEKREKMGGISMAIYNEKAGSVERAVSVLGKFI